MASNPKIFSLQGEGLKLDSRADIEPILSKVDPKIIEEIHLGGNTIGIEAAQAIAEFLEKTEVLKVRKLSVFGFSYSKLTPVSSLRTHRSLTLQTSSPAV